MDDAFGIYESESHEGFPLANRVKFCLFPLPYFSGAEFCRQEGEKITLCRQKFLLFTQIFYGTHAVLKWRVYGYICTFIYSTEAKTDLHFQDVWFIIHKVTGKKSLIHFKWGLHPKFTKFLLSLLQAISITPIPSDIQR